MDFRYKLVKPQVIRPIIPVLLFSDNGKYFGYEALIDSGADLNIFPFDIGTALGLEVKKGEPHDFVGVTGDKSKGYVHIVELGIGQDRFKAPVVFSEGIATDGYGILGQLGFFSQFTVKFMYQSAKVRISRTIGGE